jgi:hypothetical protein
MTSVHQTDPTDVKVAIRMWTSPANAQIHDTASNRDKTWLRPEVEIRGKLDLAWWIMNQLHEQSGMKHTFDVEEIQ